MTHEMRLNNEPFEKIKNGTKNIELRLYDEKRKLINVRDLIKFINRLNNETLLVEVIGLHIYSSFNELYNHFDKVSLGYNEEEEANPLDMSKYYSDEDIQRYGVVGIEIKLRK